MVMHVQDVTCGDVYDGRLQMDNAFHRCAIKIAESRVCSLSYFPLLLLFVAIQGSSVCTCLLSSAWVRIIIYGVLTLIFLIAALVMAIFNRGMYLTRFATPVVNSDIWDMELKFLSGVGVRMGQRFRSVTRIAHHVIAVTKRVHPAIAVAATEW